MVMMDEDRIRLTGTGLFKVGIHLIPPVYNFNSIFYAKLISSNLFFMQC